MKSTAFRTGLQVGLLLLLWVAGEALVRLLHVPLPGGIVALATLLLLLFTGWLRLDAVKGGADWLLAQMLLFFVPAMAAAIGYPQFLGLLGLKLLLVIAPGTLVVMAVTALVVELASRACRPAAQRDAP